MTHLILNLCLVPILDFNKNNIKKYNFYNLRFQESLKKFDESSFMAQFFPKKNEREKKLLFNLFLK